MKNTIEKQNTLSAKEQIQAQTREELRILIDEVNIELFDHDLELAWEEIQDFDRLAKLYRAQSEQVSSLLEKELGIVKAKKMIDTINLNTAQNKAILKKNKADAYKSLSEKKSEVMSVITSESFSVSAAVEDWNNLSIDDVLSSEIYRKEIIDKLQQKDNLDSTQQLVLDTFRAYDEARTIELLSDYNDQQLRQEIYEYEQTQEQKKKQEESASQGNSSYTPTEMHISSYDSPMIMTPSGDEIKISKQESAIIQNNPEAEKNLIEFYETLQELGLWNIWEYRMDIANSLGSLNGVDINYNDDSLWEHELKVFINAILKSTGNKTIDTNQDIWEFKNAFKNQNNYQVIWEWFQDDITKKWSSKIEEVFLKKYVLWYPKFQTSLFINEIQKKS